MTTRTTCTVRPPRRRALMLGAAGWCCFGDGAWAAGEGHSHPQRRWYEAAEAMRQRAIGWGDEPYGAVVVLPDGRMAEGPSRVVKDGDPDAHAERVALREAGRLLGRADLTGAVLYATSRPCRLCERAAALAGVRRLFVGEGLEDVGPPKP